MFSRIIMRQGVMLAGRRYQGADGRLDKAVQMEQGL